MKCKMCENRAWDDLNGYCPDCFCQKGCIVEKNENGSPCAVCSLNGPMDLPNIQDLVEQIVKRIDPSHKWSRNADQMYTYAVSACSAGINAVLRHGNK